MGNVCKIRRLFLMSLNKSSDGGKFFDLDILIERSDTIRLEKALDSLEDGNAVRTRNWQTQESIRQSVNRDLLRNISDWSGLS